MRSRVFSLLWKLALSMMMTSPGWISSMRHSSIQMLNISVLVLHSNLMGASTSIPHHSVLSQSLLLVPARRVVLLYLYPYCSESIGLPTGDQLRFFISLWSIPLSSMYMILQVFVIFWIFSMVPIVIWKIDRCPSFLSLYLTSFFYSCSSYCVISWVLLRQRQRSGLLYLWG